MRKVTWCILLGVVLLLVSCRIQNRIQVVQSPPAILPDTTALPSFPSELLYVLGARWETDITLQQQNIAEYLEQELLRLYPEKAYEGYLSRLCMLADSLLVSSYQKPTLFIPHFQEIKQRGRLSSSSVSGMYAILDSISMEEELTLLEMTPEEQATWDTLQSLVHSPNELTREMFDTMDISFFEEENILLTLMLWRGPRLFYRVLQSKARAEKMAQYYYGDATNNGRMGDAFKHIYVNVLMRTYVGDWVTRAVMDVFWEWYSPNAPCDHFMDLHNNSIGRETRYEEFTDTDKQCSNTRNWLQWAEHVQHFVQDSINAHYQGWDKETPTFVVEPAARQVSDVQYIYWGK